MRRLIFILILFGTVKVFSQTWAPNGAKWAYSTVDIFSNSWTANLQSIGDTLFQSKNCKVIQSSGVGYCTNGSSLNHIFLYPDTDKVYYYNDYLNKFCLLYDFTRLPGDTFYIQVHNFDEVNDSVGFRIDSIGFTDVDTNHLRTQYLTPFHSLNNFYGLYGNIIEYIGHTAFLFPIDMDMCDVANTGYLICYYDSIIDYHPDSPSSCSTIGIDEIKTFNRINIFPNPTTDFINIGVDKDLIYQIKLYDIFGRLIITKHKTNLIDLSSLQNGIYVLEITDKNNNKINLKIIKNAS